MRLVKWGCKMKNKIEILNGGLGVKCSEREWVGD